MLKNYLKTAFRGFAKHKGFTFINISGLAIGIACCLLIFVYVKDELTHDRFHENADDIYRVTGLIDFGGKEISISATSIIGPKIFSEEIPEITDFARFDSNSGIVQHGDEYIENNRMLFADPSIFQMFDFEPISGELTAALSEPNNVVLTQVAAERFFGKTDVVGETMRVRLKSDFETLVVSAVIENHPVNSSFYFELLLPWVKNETFKQPYQLTNWGMLSITSFVQLAPGTDPDLIVDKMEATRVKHHPDSTTFARRIESGLQPFQDIHLDTDFGGGSGLKASSDPVYSYVLSGIAFLILIIACINFTNLTVARSLPRAREVGIRKVVGAVRSQLSVQFLIETFIMCCFAFVLGMIIAELLMPFFGELTEKKLDISLFDDPVLVLSSLIIVLFTALFSGFYPAFVTSGFNVVKCLKGGTRVKGKNYITRGLIVAQFVIASVLIIGALTMRSQVDYMVNKDLGYDDEHLYRVQDFRRGESTSVLEQMRAELASNPNIIQVSGSDGYGSMSSLKKDDGEEFMSATFAAEHDYLKIKGIELLRGRHLKKEDDRTFTDTDTLINVIVNEAFLDALGWEEGIGRQIGGMQVVGVMPDYHSQNVKSDIGPLLMRNIHTANAYATDIFVKFRPEYLPEIRSELERVWRKFAPYHPFEAELLSEVNASRYEDEARWNKIIYMASSLAIFISCMGLLGLAHLRTLQRIKEIGIRKVLGATVTQIILLLNAHFVKLVLVSVVVASPLAYYFIDQWLANFANQVPVTWYIFLVPGVIVMSIALLTVSLQSLRHARNNPVDALRYE